MENLGRCAKCNGTEVVRVTCHHDIVQTGFFSYITMYRRVCLDCGFTELWVDKNNLEPIRRRYRKR